MFVYGLWCPRMRGGVVDGFQGDGGLIRKIPDRGGVRCCLVGLCGVTSGVALVKTIELEIEHNVDKTDYLLTVVVDPPVHCQP